MNEYRQKNRSFRIKEKALLALNEGDKNFPLNPGHLISAEKQENKDLEKLFEDSLKNRKFKAGQIVTGTIMDIKKDFVIVDIGFKSEGVISKSEFQHSKDKETLSIGQNVEVYIDCIEDDNNMVSLSKDKADISKAWQDIIRTAENKETIQGTVVAQVRGGLSVDIGVKAFLPGSQIDVRPVKDLKSLVGKTFHFKVIKMNQKRRNIVLSRRALLEKERESIMTPPASLSEGAVVKGIVKNITEYGAFVDLGEIDGLLHITDISWTRLKHPSEELKVGQEITVKILKFDREKKRISLGIKQLNDKTWIEEAHRAAEQEFVIGKVVKLMDYGAFIVLKNGLEGLVHINEISWTKKAKNPVRSLEVGQEVRVKVIDIQKETHKLSFSIKQTEKNPWEEMIKTYSVGDVLELPVASINEFGIFLTTKEGIDGLVHASDISWTENFKFSDKYSIGEKVQVKVLDINPKEGKFSLGIKQLSENPWDSIEEKYPIGSRHEVEAIHIVDFEVFVKLQDNIEGLIHISELSRKRVQNPRDIVKAGDQMVAEILSIDSESKKISLSRRLVETEGEEKEKSSSKENKKQIRKTSGLMDNIFARALKGSLMKNEDLKKSEAKDSNEKPTTSKVKKAASSDKKSETTKKKAVAASEKKEAKVKKAASSDKKSETAKKKAVAASEKKEAKAKKAASSDKKSETTKKKAVAASEKKEAKVKKAASSDKKSETTKKKAVAASEKKETKVKKAASSDKKSETTKKKAVAASKKKETKAKKVASSDKKSETTKKKAVAASKKKETKVKKAASSDKKSETKKKSTSSKKKAKNKT